MEKKEVYICQQQPNIEEDEIDLRELFNIILKYKTFIVVFTSIFTIFAVIYSLFKTPIYQIESFVEIGYYNSNSNSNSNSNISDKRYFIDPNNALITIQNKFVSKDGKFPLLDQISFKKGTTLLDIKIDGYSNTTAEKYLQHILDFIKRKESKKIELFLKTTNLKIANLKIYKKTLEKQLIETKKQLNIKLSPLIYQSLLNNINILNDKIFNINQQLVDLHTYISPLNITKTHIVGNIIKQDYPIKPKKKLIVIVAFITSFKLSIFIVFFIEFIRNQKKEIS